MVLENKYLKKAVEKAGFVIVVKTCNLEDKTAKMEYISANAGTVGMNVELLNKGLKLTEDYIHPEDRARVINAVRKAMESNVSEYSHDYRMVGDDGRIFEVTNEICITKLSDTLVSTEFYISKADGREKKSESKKAAKRSADQKQADYSKAAFDDKIHVLLDVFAKTNKLYSAYVDMDGKIIYPPTGPSTNLGDFYDLFEKPEYKEYYKKIKMIVEENAEAVILEREEGGIGKIAAAPVIVDNKMNSIWILGSYTKEETERLTKLVDCQWQIANVVSDYIKKNQIVEVEMARAKGAGKKLREELARQGIINEALSKVNSRLIDSADEVIAQTLREVGINMDLDMALLYSYDKNNEFHLKSYWNVKGETPGEELVEYYPSRRYIIEERLKQDINRYTIDASTTSHEKKLDMMKYNLKACITCPIYEKDRLKSILLFAVTKADRTWTNEELVFSKSISVVIRSMLENAESDDNIRNVNQHLIETYNNFRIGIFVRNASTGEVLFSNKKMNEMMGRDFVGGNSKEIITDLHDRFDNINGMRKPFISQDVSSWRSYIQKMDMIMDITEIKMEWLNGEAASLLILRKAKDEEFVEQ